jgi:hypothetical protein
MTAALKVESSNEGIFHVFYDTRGSHEIKLSIQKQWDITHHDISMMDPISSSGNACPYAILLELLFPIHFFQSLTEFLRVELSHEIFSSRVHSR